MQLQAKRPQANVAQAPVHHLQRGHFFGHEQHRLALGQAVRNQVGDSLALAGAGRAFKHQVTAGVHRANGFQLRRVGQQRRQNVLRRVAGVEPVKFAGRAFSGKGLAGVVHQVPHDAALPELLGAVLQVFPHQILGERKNAQVRLLQHFPLRNFAHRQPERLQHLRHINALVIQRQHVQPRDLQLEIGFQQMQQRRVDDGFVVMAQQAKAAAYRLALQRDRNQQQRRQVHGFSAWRLSPAQQAHG